MERIVGWLLVVLLAGVAGMVRADDALSANGEQVAPEDYLQYLTELRSGFNEGKPRKLSTREWKMFDEADATARRLLAGREDAEGLSEQSAAQLFTAQEKVVAILEAKENERLICRREGTTGSHRKQTKCTTAAQREAQSEAAQQWFRDRPARKLGPGG